MYLCFECDAWSPSSHKTWCSMHPDQRREATDRYYRRERACHCAHHHRAGRLVAA